MKDFKYDYTETIELKIDAVKEAYAFGKNFENIEKGKVVGISCYPVNKLTVSPLGDVVVNDTVFNKAYLLLKVNGEDKLTNIPLIELNPFANNGIIRQTNDFAVTFNQSLVKIGNTTGIVIGETFVFNFYYKKDF